eukprot:jgi/Antlo1/1254/2500
MSTLYVFSLTTFLLSSINLTSYSLERCTVSAVSSGGVLLPCVPRQHSTCIPRHTILCRYMGCFSIVCKCGEGVVILCCHFHILDDAPSSAVILLDAD